jgi:hypothetical protein
VISGPEFTPPRGETSDLLVKSQVLRQERAQEMGLIGRIIGSRDHAPFNIAAFVAILATLSLLIIIVFSPDPAKLDFATKVLLPIILAVLGYLFGRGTS